MRSTLRRMAVAIVLVPIAAGATPARQDVEAARRAIQSALDRYGKTVRAAVNTKDYSRLKAVQEEQFHPNYVGIGFDGKRYTRSQALKKLWAWLSSIQNCSRYSCAVHGLKLEGKAAATGLLSVDIVCDVPDAKTGRLQRARYTQSMRCVWARATTGWQCTHAQGLTSTSRRL